MLMMTPWVQRLLLINVAVFLVTVATPEVRGVLAFVPGMALLKPWAIVTYAFVHAGFAHLFLNMLMLFFFGPRLEERLGTRTFIWFYLACGAGGAVLSVAQPNAAVVGASGAVYGVVLGFARYWPRERIHIWGIIPVQARALAIVMVVFSLFAGISGTQSGIAHFAHLGGAVAGWFFLRWWERRRHRRVATARPSAARRGPRDAAEGEAMRRWEAIPRERLHEINRDEVDHLLRKARKFGAHALTPDERAFLERIAGST